MARDLTFARLIGAIREPVTIGRKTRNETKSMTEKVLICLLATLLLAPASTAEAQQPQNGTAAQSRRTRVVHRVPPPARPDITSQRKPGLPARCNPALAARTPVRFDDRGPRGRVRALLSQVSTGQVRVTSAVGLTTERANPSQAVEFPFLSRFGGVSPGYTDPRLR